MDDRELFAQFAQENVEQVAELICSQDEPGTSKSTRQIATELMVSKKLVCRIAKFDLGLTAFRRVPMQVINDTTKQKRLERSKKLLRRLNLRTAKRVFFTDEKIFYINSPINNQNNHVWAKESEPHSSTLQQMLWMVQIFQFLLGNLAMIFL